MLCCVWERLTSSSSSSKQQMRLGISEPVSLAGPSPADLAATRALDSFLRQHGLYESEEGKVTRNTKEQPQKKKNQVRSDQFGSLMCRSCAKRCWDC